MIQRRDDDNDGNDTGDDTMMIVLTSDTDTGGTNDGEDEDPRANQCQLVVSLG